MSILDLQIMEPEHEDDGDGNIELPPSALTLLACL